jgi:hypothetical protein
MLNLTPDPYMLLGMQNQNLPWHKALAELIDNSLDADANSVSIRLDSSAVVVSDNGRGIRDFQASLKLGGHHKSETTVLGKYGIGLKDAWLFAGDRMQITTTHKGFKATVVVDIDELANNKWQVESPVLAETDEPSGTVIKLFLRKGRQAPSSDAFEKLSWVFTPALLEGKQIIRQKGIHGIPLQAKRVPPLSKSIAEQFTVEGKAVDIHIGIMQEGERIYSGPFWIQYGHRYIGSGSIGVGDYSTQGMAGVIKLGKGWALTKNKDDISELRDELAEEIHKRIEPLLKEAQAKSQSLFISQLRVDCENMLNLHLQEHLREARTKPAVSQRGTVLAVGTGRRRRNATKVHDAAGSVVRIKGSNGGRVKIDFNQLGDQCTAAIFDPSDYRVMLNTDHPFVAKAQTSGNRPVINLLAVIALHQYQMENRDGNRLAFSIADPVMAFGQLLNGGEAWFNEAAS